MLLLELLGTLSLRSDARPVPVAAQQKRPLALVALVALAGKSGLSRERIEAYLWPEAASGRGRHSLDQNVYALRHALGVEVILSARGELSLDPDLVRVDLWEFERSIRDGDWEAGVANYKGPLLDGFHLGESKELESWIDAERRRVLEVYQSAVEQLAQHASTVGDHSRSIRWRRTLASSDPLSAGVAKKLINALAAGGDRASAVKHARVYQALVRQQLEIEPDLEIERLAVDYSRQVDTPVPESPIESKRFQPDGSSSHALAVPNERPVLASAPTTRVRERVLLYSVIPTVALMTGAVLWGWLRPEPPEAVVRFTPPVDSAEEIAPAVSDIGRMALSPDGSTLAYIGRARGELLVRRFAELRAIAIPNADNATTPFFSPNGRQVGFLRDHMVRIAAVSGDSLPIDVSDTLTGQSGASWASDDFIYVNGANWTGLFRVKARAGAVPQPFTVLDTAGGETDHRWPDVLPNGKGLLFTATFGGKASKDRPTHAIAVADIPSGRHHIIVRDAMFARYAKSGYLLYVTTNKTLMAAPFDQGTMKVTGAPKAVIEGMRLGLWGSADLAVSASGTLVYTTGRSQLKEDLVWVTRAGEVTAVDSAWSGNVLAFPAISPDGKSVAISRRVADEFIRVWIKPLAGGGSIMLPPDGGYDVNAAWTPDGKLLTYASVGRLGAVALWTRRADGSGSPPVLQFRQTRSVYNPHWSPDGRWLVFQSERAAGGIDILGVRPGVDEVPVPLVAGAATKASSALSPDGRWLAYDSNETGHFEIYVVPFPNTGAAKWAISSGGGTEPQWSHKGSELFYRDKAGYLTAVRVTTTPTLSVGRRTTLFPAAAYEANEYAAQYAVAPDDKRFLMIRQFDANVPDRIVVVEHWFQELADAGKSRKE